jgi:predicted NBD/HSP70 family sugar kinase
MIFSKQMIKEFNTTAVFDLINKSMPISRARIAKITGLSPTTVSTLTQNMIDFGIVCETGFGESVTSGRRPVLLEVNPPGAYIVAMEVSPGSLTGALYDATCRTVLQQTREIDDFNALGSLIRDTLKALIADARIREDKFLGLSVGIPAILDPETKRIASSTILPIDPGVDFLAQVREAFPGRIISAGNESAYAAYAEWNAGHHGPSANLVYIDVNIGIGAGIIIGGDIYTGAAGNAGEIGHMSIDADGPRCKCGAKGCLEVVASIPAALKKMRRAALSGEYPSLARLTGGSLDNLSAETLFEAYARKDPPAVEIATDIAAKLAAGINNIINLFDPQCVVIGGEITCMGPDFLSCVQDRYSRITMRRDGPAIRYAAVGGNPVIAGGSAWILGQVVRNIGAIVHK